MQDRLIEETFYKYKDYLTAVIKTVGKNISDADVDDILSDIYLKLCRTSQMYDEEKFSFSVSEYQESADDGVKYTEYDSLSDFSEAEISTSIRQFCDEQIKYYKVRYSNDDASWRVEIMCGENGLGIRSIDIVPFGFSDYLAGSEKEGVDLATFEDRNFVYLISVQENMTTVFFVENAVLYTLNMNYMQADEAESFIKEYIIR